MKPQTSLPIATVEAEPMAGAPRRIPFIGPRLCEPQQRQDFIWSSANSSIPTPATLLRVGAPRSPGAAYSIIEFIGVLAVIAILAAILIPVVVKHVDIAAVNAETANLNSISNALVLQVVRNDIIPDETSGASGWATAVGNWLSLPASNISTNSRHYNRMFVIDTNGFGSPSFLPYTQANTGLAAAPPSPRLMIVSSLSANLPASLLNKPGLAVFNDLWNTTPGNLPVNSMWAKANWKGRGDDLLIQKINLQPFFYQLILNNRDTNTLASFSINTTNLLFVTPGSVSNAYYFGSSVVGLSSNSTVQTKYVLTRNIGYVFENGVWGGQIGNGPGSINTNASASGSSFGTIAANFLASPLNSATDSNGAKGADQESVLSAMANIMMTYTLWASEGFTKHGISDSGNEPINEEWQDIGSKDYLGQDTGTGNWGLLK